MSKSRLERITLLLSTRQDDVTILLDQVHKKHNLSAIIRTADALGIPKIHAIENRAKDLRTYRHASSGADKWVQLQIHQERPKILNELKKTKHKLICTHASEHAVDFRELDYTQPFALILGAEKWGVSDITQAQADHHITIPMYGMVESYNVSVANAIILAEMQRQRLQAGLYNPKPIDPMHLFECLHPKTATICQNNNWSYPSLDEEGDIKDPVNWLKSQETQQ